MLLSSKAKRSVARLLIFCKAPVAGLVKTRLIPAIGAKNSVVVAKTLLARTLDQLDIQRLNHYQVQVVLCCAPSCGHSYLRNLASQYQLIRQVQVGSDLGQRMHKAIKKNMAYARYVIIIGSDCPELTFDYIKRAVLALQKKVDVVIAPAADGGYGLIATAHVDSRLFAGIPWGTNKVLSKTISRLEAANYQYYQLPELRDLDRFTDYLYYKKLLFEARKKRP